MLELNKIHCGACETVMKDIDSEDEYCEIARKRISAISNNLDGWLEE